MTAAPLSSPTLLTSGDILEGRYRILHLLAVGGMGSVFLAEHLLIKRRLAVKVLHPELARDRLIVTRFMNEAMAAGTLGHPNIVEATDMGFVNDLPFIVFEYLEGPVLTEEIYRVRGLGVRRALDITIQIASALDAAHAAGIIHLDLKCDNVILTDRGGTSDHVKVLDFGISRFATSDMERTNPTVLAGTPEFMAPEQIEDPDSVDPRTDVYALGVCLYEMLAARAPFSGEDARVLLHRVVHEPPPPLPASVPAELRRTITDRMLAKDPAARFHNMEQVIDALKEIAFELRASSVSGSDLVLLTPSQAKQIASEPVYPTAPSRRGGKLAMVGLAVVVLGAAIAAMLLLGGHDTAPTSATAAVAAPVRVSAPVANPDRIRSGIELAKQRARATASSPMLRAAIETDAATVQDLLRTEASFELEAAETMEIYQTRDGEPMLLARIPNGAQPLAAGTTRVDLRSSPARVEVSVPVLDRQAREAGLVVLAVPLDGITAADADAVRAIDPAIQVVK